MTKLEVKMRDLLDDAEMHLGNLCLECGLDDECPEYEAWQRIQEFLEKHPKPKKKGGKK